VRAVERFSCEAAIHSAVLSLHNLIVVTYNRLDAFCRVAIPPLRRAVAALIVERFSCETVVHFSILLFVRS
jgi:hypothetical protein